MSIFAADSSGVVTAHGTVSARQLQRDRDADFLDEPRDEWISLNDAARLLSRHTNGVKSIALAGGIRVRALPGARILYNRTDCERLASA
jgi:hypothetical protein